MAGARSCILLCFNHLCYGVMQIVLKRYRLLTLKCNHAKLDLLFHVDQSKVIL